MCTSTHRSCFIVVSSIHILSILKIVIMMIYARFYFLTESLRICSNKKGIEFQGDSSRNQPSNFVTNESYMSVIHSLDLNINEPQ